MSDGLNETELGRWIRNSLRENSNILAGGYQGKTLLYDDGSQRLVIKVPLGKGPMKYFHTVMLRHEYKVYLKLAEFAWAPKCHGMIDNTFLVLEYIEGQPIKNSRPDNEMAFFSQLFTAITTLHDLDVAHMDLKKKDNLLVTKDGMPCLIDFGAASIRKPGFHPFNHYWFNLAKRFDRNAWIKHKYHTRLEEISDEDIKYYKRTFTEKLASKIKKSYTRLKGLLGLK